jgi:hypothetical protein
VVGCGRYCIVGDNLAHNSQEIIFTIGIAGFVVKTMKQEFEVDNTLPQCFDVIASSVFIELSNSSSGEDLTPLPLLMKLTKKLFNLLPLCC